MSKKIEKSLSSIIKTYSGEIYIIQEKTPEEIQLQMEGQNSAVMPNGDVVKTSHIAMITSWESYRFQTEQKERHKKGQWLEGKMWMDMQGEVIRANLKGVTGDLKELGVGEAVPQLK